MEGRLIIEPFNRVFFGLFLIFLLILIVATILLKDKDERIKRNAVLIASGITLVGYFLYKYALSLDTEFNTVAESIGGFNWWGELPLHLCNVNMILIPISVLTKKKPLLGFCFFVGPLGALMALVMPGIGFGGFSLLIPRMLGYYCTHFMVIILGLSLVTLGFYHPRYQDIPTIVLATIAITFIAFAISTIIRTLGLNPNANYFFTIDTEDNPILEMLHKKIPIPFIYELPLSIVLFLYMMVVTTGFHVFERNKDAEAKHLWSNSIK